LFELILLTVFAVFFAFLNSYKEFEYGLKISFLLIFLFLAFRYNYGNDYMGYYQDFLDVNHYSKINYHDIAFHYEPGWLFLCRIFAPIGFFAMVMFLSLINSVVYYRFISTYVPKKYYWLAVFIYICDPGFMLIQASAMRQSLAICLFIVAIPYIFKKDFLRYSACILLGYLFHSSALILWPLYFLGFVNWRINKNASILIFLLFVSLFLFGKYLLPFLDQFILKNFERYEGYHASAVIGTGIGLIYSSILFIVVLYFARFQVQETALIFKIAIFSFMFIPLSFLIQIVGRIGMYFEPATLIAYPLVLKHIKKEYLKVIFLASFLGFTGYIFFQFFHSDLWSEAFGTYHTIFTAPKID
jgi:transmembrane protein EpsG